MNRATVAWVVVVVPVWLVFVLCTYWEPVMRDGWGHVIWHRNNDLSLASVWDFAKASYTHNNPRLGQIATLLQHTPGPWHPLVTPVFELALFFLLTTLVLGRWPSLRRTDDALLCATIIAMVFVCARSLGPMLFYRPFTGNYLISLVINLAWLVPYRLHAESARPRPWWFAIPMLVLGVASGLCNEHTSPTFIVAGLLAIVVFWRRGERFVPWAWLGLVGMIAGTAALYLAPGQDIRYNGLATHQSTLERIVERGAHGNGRILLLLLIYLAPLVIGLLLGVIAKLRGATAVASRSQRIAELVLLAMSFTIVATLLASPKLGDRLYFASICLACAAVAGWVVSRLGTAERWLAAGVAAVVISFVSYRLVTAYHQAAREFAARVALIKAAPPGSTVSVPPYSQSRSRYVLGDDFIAETSRSAAADVFGRAAIQLDHAAVSTPPADEP